MRQIGVTVLVLLLSLAVAVSRTAADHKGEAKTDNRLVGTWSVVSAKYNGKEVQRPAGWTQLKHVTPTQFMWAWYDPDGKVSAALGGTYTLKGDDYVEIPEYGVGGILDALKGKPQVFKCKVEGNKWYHNGKLSGGTTIEEVWERVAKSR
jgi:hypothetical protein